MSTTCGETPGSVAAAPMEQCSRPVDRLREAHGGRTFANDPVTDIELADIGASVGKAPMLPVNADGSTRDGSLPEGIVREGARRMLTAAPEAEQERDLSDTDCAFVGAEGVHLRIRLELIAMTDGSRESSEARAGLLRDCARRGMRAPVLAVGDGAPGFWKALRGPSLAAACGLAPVLSQSGKIRTHGTHSRR